MTGGWGGRRATAVRGALARTLPRPCYRCGLPVEVGQAWDVEHKIPCSLAPQLAYHPGNLDVSHARCNRAHGQSLTTRAGQLGPLPWPWS